MGFYVAHFNNDAGMNCAHHRMYALSILNLILARRGIFDVFEDTDNVQYDELEDVLRKYHIRSEEITDKYDKHKDCNGLGVTLKYYGSANDFRNKLIKHIKKAWLNKEDDKKVYESTKRLIAKLKIVDDPQMICELVRQRDCEVFGADDVGDYTNIVFNDSDEYIEYIFEHK